MADMTLVEARRILEAQDMSDISRTLEAVALVLRFEGIATPSLLPIAGQLESIAGQQRATTVKEGGSDAAG